MTHCQKCNLLHRYGLTGIWSLYFIEWSVFLFIVCFLETTRWAHLLFPPLTVLVPSPPTDVWARSYLGAFQSRSAGHVVEFFSGSKWLSHVSKVRLTQNNYIDRLVIITSLYKYYSVIKVTHFNTKVLFIWQQKPICWIGKLLWQLQHPPQS